MDLDLDWAQQALGCQQVQKALSNNLVTSGGEVDLIPALIGIGMCGRDV